MKYIIYLFYRYYNKGGTIRIPYESAILAILMLIFVNIMSLMMMLAPKLTITLVSNHARIELFIYSSLGVIIGYFILSRLFPKREILEVNTIHKNFKLHGWMLALYCILSFVFLMFLIVKHRS